MRTDTLYARTYAEFTAGPKDVAETEEWFHSTGAHSLNGIDPADAVFIKHWLAAISAKRTRDEQLAFARSAPIDPEIAALVANSLPKTHTLGYRTVGRYTEYVKTLIYVAAHLRMLLDKNIKRKGIAAKRASDWLGLNGRSNAIEKATARFRQETAKMAYIYPNAFQDAAVLLRDTIVRMEEIERELEAEATEEKRRRFAERHVTAIPAKEFHHDWQLN